MNDALDRVAATAGRPWRLLIVVNVPWFFVMHRLPIAVMARERGAEVHVACGEGEGAEEIIAQGFVFHRLKLTRTPFAPFRDLAAIFSLANLYRRLHPDIVHHVTLKPVLYGSIASRIAGVPAVVNAFAGLGYMFSGTSPLAILRQRLLQSFLSVALKLRRQVVVFENADDRELLTEARAVPEKQSIVISGIGVDTSIYRAIPEPAGSVRVLFASRMLREKGVEYFVEAARRLKRQGVVADFVLIGTPDPFSPGSISVEQLRAWNQEQVVDWQGFQRDMPGIIQAAHIVCLPTYYREGVPRILLEGAACARPLVTTDMPGCRDIVKNGINGFVVAPHDVEQLVESLSRLIRDPALRLQFGQASRYLAEQKFALPKVLDQFWDVYSGLRMKH